jgi:acyl-coenzyme A thioesterase PaaI-like protein
LALSHHDLCFGCGLANLFGLQLEAALEEDGTLTGRCFVKQDHQGPPGFAHGAIVTAVLDEAMALLVHAEGVHALTRRLEVDLLAPVPVGAFVHARAGFEERLSDEVLLRAELDDGGGRTLAVGRAVFARVDSV